MVEKNLVSEEFEGSVDRNGMIRLPEHVHDLLKRHHIGKVHVRLRVSTVAGVLRGLGVSEEEIDRIASVQLEPQDQVVKFLLAEGRLKAKRGRLEKATRTGTAP
jgi:hypothetical protein